MPAVLDRIVAPSGRRPGVQGIASNLDDLLLRGGKWKAQIGDALIAGTLERTISGGSTIRLELHDDRRRLLRSPLLETRYFVKLDELGFRLCHVEDQGRVEPLVLEHESETVARLRAKHGPAKAFRDKVTRAEFLRRRVHAVAGPPIRFVCPQLHVHQPIKDWRDSEEAREQAKEDRRKGLDGESRVEVKSERATSAQIKIGDRALRVAESEQAPLRVMVALVAALIDESEMGRTSRNVLQITPETAGEGGIDPNNVEASVHGFLTGYYRGASGAIGFYKAHPDASPAEIATAIQGNRDGASVYAPFVAEARHWVEVYAGGGGTISMTEVLRYAFEQKKKEDVWALGTRLGKEVNWRWFESAGAVYFIDERELLDSMRRMIVDDSGDDGIEDTSFDYDVGKPITEFTIEARARNWAAPPGTVVEITDHGPADGRYLVEKIEAPLATRNSICTITLKRPTEPLPEPAPQTKNVSVGFGGGGSEGSVPSSIEKMIAEIDRIDAKHWSYSSPGARGTPPPADGPYDCSGFVSRVLYVGGLLDHTVVSGELANMYQPGAGEWLTIYADAGHVLGRIRTADGWRFFATSSSNKGGGAGWVPDSEYSAGYLAAKAARHPKRF